MLEAQCESPNCTSAMSTKLQQSPTSADGARICLPCVRKLDEALQELPLLYARCGVVLHGERTRGFGQTRGRNNPGIVLRDTLVTARTELLSLLSSWASLVAEEARLPLRPRREVTALVRFLLDNLSFLVSHPAIVDAIEEFARVCTRARHAINPTDYVALGLCERPGCGRKVYAHIDPGGVGSGVNPVSCEAGHAVDPRQWLSLAQRFKQGGTSRKGSIA